MRLDRGIRVMLVRDCVPGQAVWLPGGLDGDWLPGEIAAVSDDGDEIIVDDGEIRLDWVPRWQLRFRDPARQGRDKPRDRAEAPALKPKLKPGQVAKLGVLSSGDIVGGQK